MTSEDRKEYHREYYRKNKESIRIKQAIHRKKEGVTEKMNAQRRQWYQDNKEKVSKYQKEYNAQNKTRINEYVVQRKRTNKERIIEYLGGKCITEGCTMATKPYHLDVHHTDGKNFNIGNMTSFSWTTIKKELDDCKCVLICALCHRDITHGHA